MPVPANTMHAGKTHGNWFGLHRVEGDLQSQSGGDSTDRAKALDGIVPHPAKGGFMPKVLIPGFLTLGQAAPLGYDPAQPPAARVSNTATPRSRPGT